MFSLLRMFSVPRALLPEVKDCAADFGVSVDDCIGGDTPVCGIAGDQQAALIGQAGFEPGMTKSTYGTGCFVVANTGDKALRSDNHLLTALRQSSADDGSDAYRWQGDFRARGKCIRRRIRRAVVAR
jgi:glycerol kinase